MKIASILRSRRIYREIIEGDEPTKPLDSSTNVDDWKKYDEWQIKNDEAFGVIILSLVTEQAAMFINETRAKRVWESLKNMYGGNNEEKIIDAMLELKDLRMARSENVNQYVTRIKGMVAKVIALGGKITDREAVYYLVRGLDSRLESIAVVLRARKDQNIDEVHQILKEEETRLGKNTDTGGWSKNREENAYRSRQRVSKQDRVIARECYVFRKVGHIARECWHKNKVRVNKEHEVREVKMKNEYAQIMKNDDTQRHNAFNCTQKHVEKKSMSHSKWNLDSGCSVHMTSERKYLKQIEPNESIINMAESGRNIKAVEKGGMNMKTMVDGKEVNLKMNNVLYVPKLRDNLLSVGELVRRGNRVEFDETGATIYGKAGRIIAKGKEENNMYVVEGWIDGQDMENNDRCTRETEQCALSRQDEKMIWHRRLGHLNGHYMDKMCTGNVVRGLTYSGGTDLKCESCILGKMTEMTYKRVDGPIASRPLDLLYMDLCGPMGKASLGGNRYIFVIVDAYTKRIFVELLTYKSETYDRFMKYKRRSENQMGTKINRIRTDNGTEFVNQQFKDMFKREGVKHERTVIYSPSSNGLAERTNRTLLETVRTMLIDSKLPIHFWGEATITAAYLRNCGYRKGLDGITPMEKWSGRKPCVKHLKPFGCVAYGLIPKPLRNKLGPRGRKGIMVGYSRDRRAYRLYMLDQDRVEEFRSVTFIEDENGSKYMGSTGENTMEVEQIRYNLDGENERIQTENGRNRLEKFVTHEIIKDRTEEPSGSQQQMEGGEIQEERREIENEQMEDDETGDTDTPEPDIDIPELNQELQMELEDRGEASRRGRPVGTKKGVVQTRERRKCEETELEYQRKGVRRSTRIEEKKKSEEHVNQTEVGKAEKKIPKNYKEAMESEDRDKWKQAMEEELKSMKEHEVWTIVDRKPQKKVLWNKWVFTKKLDANGKPNKYKARLVVMGQNQQKGIDYEENYSPVVKLESVRLIVALAAAFGQEVSTLDIKTAYLYGNLIEETYMVQPDGFRGDTNKVCQLKKSLYGLPQSGRMWNLKLNEVLESIGAKRLNCDPCLYKIVKGKEVVIIGIYVDDLLVTGTSQKIMNEIISKLGEKFHLTKGLQNGSFLGIEIIRTDDGYEITQKRQIDKLLEKYGMENCNEAKTPVEVNQKLEECGDSKTANVNELVGSLTYIANGSRPDIAFIVNKLARHSKNPKEIHLNAAKRVIRYLKGTRFTKLKYHEGRDPLEGCSDASWSSTEDGKSQSGYCIKLCGNLISWKSRKQDLVALSTCEAELNANCEVLKEIQWLSNILNELELGHLAKGPVKIYTDNRAGLDWANGLYVKQRTKHFDRKLYKIREEIGGKRIVLLHKPGEEVEADMLTKGLPICKMKKCMDSIGME